MKITKERAMLYKTARAKIACYGINEGDFVSVEYSYCKDGIPWFKIEKTENGRLLQSTYYPMDQLCDFCF